MRLVERNDLMFGRKGAIAKMRASLIMRVLGINRLNRLNEATRAEKGSKAEKILSRIGVKYKISEKDRSNIPQSGAAIVVVNHPTGALDGVVLIDLISKIRPDVKFMSNFLLDRVDYLRDYFITVDPFDSKDPKRNMRGLRESYAHLQKGGLLIIFPAGEVATWQRGFSRIKDKPWDHSIIRFIRNTKVPVLPICIEADNSLMFHIMGKINPVLRTALLPHELMNKKGKCVMVNVGSTLAPRRVEELEDLQTLGDYLRANVEYLTHKRRRRKLKIIAARKPVETPVDEITPGKDRELLTNELTEIRSKYLLFEYGNYNVFFAPTSDIPNMMHEIGRMREITFRQIGEGSMKSIDTDKYDEYYHQLFIWDNAASHLVGAYRMGLGGDIMERFGLKGFYTHSLFEMSPQMEPVMRQTIELGRSFITSGYQRKAVTLMLLWKGILYVLLKHEGYRNLLGPVTISGEFQDTSKMVIIKYLQQHHFNHKLAAYIHPLTGLEGITTDIDASLIAKISNIELINKIVCDIEREEFSVPVLIKKYLQVNSSVLGFNVDHDFNDALDALMLLDLKRVPEDTITMLSKEITDIDVVSRFKKLV